MKLYLVQRNKNTKTNRIIMSYFKIIQKNKNKKFIKMLFSFQIKKLFNLKVS